jgi:hypothetical protein
MTQLTSANRVYQRASSTGGAPGKGTGTIPVAVNVTTVGTPRFRIRSSDGTTILQAATALPAFAATGAQTLNVTGVEARLGWFYLDLSADGATWQNGTVLVGMGRLVALAGQSLAVRMLGRMDGQNATNASLGVAPSAMSAVFATYTDDQRTVSSPHWATPADGTDYDSTFVGEFLRLQVAAAGVNCGLVGHARGAQSVTAFVPGGSENPKLRANLDAAGGFETFVWMQGHSDSGAGMDATTYQNDLSLVVNDIAAHNGVRGTAFDRLVCTIPNINSTSWGSFAQQQVIRAAANAWASANNGVYVDPRDLDLIDGVHQSQLGSVYLARHFYRASRLGLGLARGDLGPTITAVSRAAGSANVVLTAALPSGASALVAVGSPASRFAVCNRGSTAALALDGTSPLTISGTTITLKLAQVPADNQALDVYFCPSPDPSNDGQTNMLYDDNANDGDGLTRGRQFTASLAPFTIAGAAASVRVGPDLTPGGNPTFQPAASGFGQERLTGFAKGAASDGSDVLQNSFTFTVALTFSRSGNPGNVEVMAGINARFWIGIASTGQIVVNTGSDNYIGGTGPSGGGSNPVVTDGARHKAAVVTTASGCALYLDGKLTASSSNYPNFQGSGVFSLGNFLDSYAFGGAIDELATFNTARYSGSSYPVETTPFTGTEPGIVALYHLNGDFNAARV